MGRSINKRVVIAALIKSRIVGLHQNISIGSTDIIDTWEPLEEGLLILETTRHVSMITITFSKEELDESSKGGQEHVISVPLVQEEEDHRPTGATLRIAQSAGTGTLCLFISFRNEVDECSDKVVGCGCVIYVWISKYCKLYI